LGTTGHGAISALAMVALLFAVLSQSALDRGNTYSAKLVSLIAANEVGAASTVGEGGKAVTLESPVPTSDNEQAAPLFDMETEPVGGGEVAEKWAGAMTEIAREYKEVEQCRSKAGCSSAARRLIDLSASGAGRSGRAKVGLINRAVDLAIKPVSDEAQWGVPDRWSAPFETLRSNRGDCEDYALVKYLALRAAGISPDDVKVIILKSVFPDEDHAALAARVDGEWLILDNRTLTLVRDTDLVRMIPMFVLDQQGARRFVWASRKPRGGIISKTS
jgi:predicted transglutaminase-like cysteine proteinase